MTSVSTAVGRVQDFDVGRVLAYVRKPDGTFVALGFFADRRAAREAVETQHDTRT
jgi:hypothetical protein